MERLCQTLFGAKVVSDENWAVGVRNAYFCCWLAMMCDYQVIVDNRVIAIVCSVLREGDVFGQCNGGEARAGSHGPRLWNINILKTCDKRSAMPGSGFQS